MSRPKNSIRLDAARIESILRQLDEAVGAHASGRRSERHLYKVRAFVEFPKIDNAGIEEVPTRNLSRDGIGLLIGRFVYPGTECRIHLWTRAGHSEFVPGRVVRCSYIRGTPGVYDVGIAFNASIDIALFHEKAASIRLLLIDSNADGRAVLQKALAQFGADVACAEDEAQARELALARNHELIVLNADSLGPRACPLAAELREQGYVRPIACVSDRGKPAACEGGCLAGCATATISPADLQALISTTRETPIVSSLAASAESSALINRFVHSLKERIAALESAFGKRDLTQVAALAEGMVTVASGCGFAPIAVAARAVHIAAATPEADGTPSITLLHALQTLVQKCQAARPARAVSGPAVDAVR